MAHVVAVLIGVSLMVWRNSLQARAPRVMSDSGVRSAFLSARPAVRASRCPPVRASGRPPVRLSACPPARVSACPPVRLSARLSAVGAQGRSDPDH